jgi:hypothetical protein
MSRITIDMEGTYVPSPEEINYMVSEEIRSVYSPAQEVKSLRMFLSDPATHKDAFDLYNAFVEKCRAEGREVKAKALLLAETLAAANASVEAPRETEV